MNILKVAETIDNFLHKCNTNYTNSLVRKNHIYIEDKNEYYDTIIKFVKKYPIFDTIKVVQLHPSAENGYPHTRPNNIICIPSNARFLSLQTTLFHEAIHIHQRNNRTIWLEFLEKEKWIPIDTNKIPERWRDKCRLNPDTIMDQFFCFENRYIPLPIFTKENNPQFGDIKVMFYDLNTGILEHNPPDSFVRKYGSNRQSEHPYEIYAVQIENSIQSNNDILSFLENRWNK